MNYEQDVDNDEQVVGVPKGIESSKPLEGFWQVYPIPAEPRLGQCV